ncbi:hypothetical protein M422DRAFT_25548 [Sphaerobolus stellatus SS14]|nr:hypothetical protein M422DRAFT_25548 [Sphaerobolus stellatus SS14]
MQHDEQGISSPDSWQRRPSSLSSYDSFQDERDRDRHARADASNPSMSESLPNLNPILSFYLSKRHLTAGNPTPYPSNLPKLTNWRSPSKLKMFNGLLLLCLNLDVDPPDVVKTNPCAVLECWVDPHSLPSNKALEAIGTNLQHQFETLNPRMKYKPLLDPSVDDARKFCINLRKLAGDERVLFYYNGHGVPKPTPSGELWVFNKTYSQYIPVSLWDLQNWLGSPCVYVWDTSSAGNLLDNYVKLAQQRDEEIRSQNAGVLPDGVTPYSDCLQLAACKANEQLPMCPELPADLFTSCLTSPIETAIRWFLLKNTNLPMGTTPDMVMQIPGDLKDRRTPLGELNWIFTAVTDTIAWMTFPRDTFKELFRRDLLVAALFRNFLLAERIMKNYHCTPHTYPPLPPTNTHPMWAAWDLAVDTCVAQLPKLLARNNNPGSEPYEYVPSSFFADSLTAFDVWLSRGGCALTPGLHDATPPHPPKPFHYSPTDPLAIPISYDLTHTHTLVPRRPPSQLPIVLQVLLAQGHRLRALISFAQFCDLGPWAVSLALTIGIFPYMVRLLQAPPGDVRPVLIFIWARIIAVAPSVRNELLAPPANSGGPSGKETPPHWRYFLTVLQTSEEPAFVLIPNAAEHRAMCAFILTSIARGSITGQTVLSNDLIIPTCLERLADSSDYLLRKWVILCIGQVWAQNDAVRDRAVREWEATEALLGVLSDEQAPDVRAAILYTLSTFLGTSGTSTLPGSSPLASLDPPSSSTESPPPEIVNPIIHVGSGCAGALPSLSLLGQYLLEAGTSTTAGIAIREDASAVVRKEGVVLISAVVEGWRGHFEAAAWVYWNEEKGGAGAGGNAGNFGVGGEREYANGEVGRVIEEWKARLIARASHPHPHHHHHHHDASEDEDDPLDLYEFASTAPQVLSGYITLFAILLELAVDPFLEVAEMAQGVVDWVVEGVLERFGADVFVDEPISQGQGQRREAGGRRERERVVSLGGSAGGGRPGLSRTPSMASTTTVGAQQSSGGTTATLKRTSSFANALKSLGTYAFPTLESFSRPASPERGASASTSRRSSHPNINTTMAKTSSNSAAHPPHSHRPSRAPSPHSHSARNSIFEAPESPLSTAESPDAVDVLDALINEDMQRLRDRRARPGKRDVPEVGDGRVRMPLKSRFYEWCNEYFMEPQMRQAESNEPGSVNYNHQLWRRSRNEGIIAEIQTQAGVAANCDWDRPVSTLQAGSAPVKIALHGFDTHVVSAHEHDKLILWDWARRKRLRTWSNDNPSTSTITGLKFINDDTDGLIVAGSSDGIIRIWRPNQDPLDVSPSRQAQPQLLTAWRAMPSLIIVKRGPGLIMEWSQGAGMFTVGGDSREIVVWDATSEMKVDNISTQSNSPLTALVADFAISPIVVAGFADGAVKTYDRRIRDADAIVRTYHEHAGWVVGAKCQKGDEKALVTASMDGEVHLWDSRNATRSVQSWHMHDHLASFDVHDQTSVFAAMSAVSHSSFRSHTATIHSIPPLLSTSDPYNSHLSSSGRTLSRVTHPTGIHHMPSLASYPQAQPSIVFHPHEMLYATASVDGAIRLLGCRLKGHVNHEMNGRV